MVVCMTGTPKLSLNCHVSFPQTMPTHSSWSGNGGETNWGVWEYKSVLFIRHGLVLVMAGVSNRMYRVICGFQAVWTLVVDL